ncbi:MAG TPA: hypothetical protein VGX50_01510 [Longimicrobium sp.]|nr:hypothetical protein [Longimicrobium sp.]
MLSAADALADHAHTLRLDAADRARTRHLGLPAVQSPDAVDFALSPGSIGMTPQLLPTGGLCGQLMPTTLAVRRFTAFQVVANICEPETWSCPEALQIIRGKMLEYEITWNPAGAALGDLLNTITLAPCEQVNIAVADWMRRETASQQQATDVQQQARQEMAHDRLITETMQSSAGNKGRAWSVGGSIGGLVKGIPLTKAAKGGPTLDLTGALGGGIAGTSSSSQIAIETTNKLSDRINWASSYVASQRSTVVFQSVASEHQTYQTRTVCNHNHCRTLTLMYYQVNRNYEVVTDYRGERDVFLVRYENAEFDAERAYCHAEILKDALLDPALLPCFDELADALFCCGVKPAEPPPKSSDKEMMIDSLDFAIKIKQMQNTFAWMRIELYTAANPFVALRVTTPVNIANWLSGAVLNLHLTLNAPVDAKQVSWMVVYLYHSGPPITAIMEKLEVVGKGPNHPGVILHSAQTDTTIIGSWRTWVEAKLPEEPAPVPGGNDCVEKSCCIRKLLGHLNCHRRYYNSLIWLNEDANERVARWSCCYQHGVGALDLMGQIVNDPLTIYGDYIVFPVAGALYNDGSVLPVSRLVTLPTPGVYAEGILGQCDTCEVVDPDRRWDWKDSPCPDCAAELGSAPTPKDGVSLSDLKPDGITNQVTFTSVPESPQGSIKDFITTLLTHADKGSTEAKSLLDKLLDTVKASIPAGK